MNIFLNQNLEKKMVDWADYFYRISFPYINHTAKKSVLVGLRRFKSFFGVSPNVCAVIWHLIKSDSSSSNEPKHLLWALLFLKQYGTEHERRTILKKDEKTIRKWTFLYIKLIGEMDVVKTFV